MTEKEFVEYLSGYKLSLVVEDDKLVLKGNKNILTAGGNNNTADKDFIIQYIKKNKPALIDFLSQTEGANMQASNKNIEAVYKLSGLQEGILFHSVFDTDALNYTNQFTCDITGVDLKMFVESWNLLLKKYSILRSAFFYDTFKVPVQSVYRNVIIPVKILDATGIHNEQLLQNYTTYLKEDREKGFDYKTPPLMRLTFFKVSNSGYKMIWTFHHLLFDGWSLPIIIGEGLKIYEQLVKGVEVQVGHVDNFQDYIKYLDRLDKEKEEGYWKDYLSPLTHGSLLPFTSYIGHTQSNADVVNKSAILRLNKTETARLTEYTHKAKVTVNTLMQAVWAYLLSQYTNSAEVVYGVIVSGRPAELPNVEQRVGMYINTLPLFAQIDMEDSFSDWLLRLQNEQINSRQHQYTPLKKIKSWTGIKEDLFDSLLVFENYPVDEMLSQNKWSVTIENVNFSEQTNYPLTVLIGQSDTLTINFQYNPLIISGGDVEKIKAHFKHILDQVIGDTSIKLSTLTLLTQEEEHQLLHDFAGVKAEYSHFDVIDMLQRNAAQHPDKLCLLHGTGSITYKEFNDRVNSLSHYLQSKGVQKDVLVGVYMHRSIEMVMALLAILKTGGAYVPIDVSYPLERVKYQLDDSAAAFVLTDETSAKLLQGETSIEIIQADKEQYFNDQSSDNLNINIAGNQLAYVMYTSGSTGKPKGVMIEHRSVRAFIGWCHKEFNASPFEVVYAGTSISFDLSVFELCYSLSAGKTIRILQNGLEAPQYLNTDKNILLNTVPSVIESLLKEKTDFSNVTVINMAGEPISAYVQQHLDQQNIEVRNLYGPTEDTTYSTIYRMHKGTPLLIGIPIDNTTVYILNDQLQLVPTGVAGEICIGGEGLARGYLNNEQLTREKFITNPFEEKTENRRQKGEDRREGDSRLYKTGDIGRWTTDGNIEYLGRKDEQVKISGYRIELGEIENVLLQSGLVTQAVVTAQADNNGNKRLVGYVVSEHEIDKAKLSAQLAAKLPAYMIPALWVQLKELPLTPNGKVDKKALPLVDATTTQKQYTAPTTELEQALANIWQELLGIEKVGVDDNFFELGGDSILTIQAVSRAGKLGYRLQPRDIFVHQTISRISKTVNTNKEQTITAEQGQLTGPAGLLPIQQWYLQHATNSVSHYNQAVLLSVDKSVSAPLLQSILNVLAKQHDALRFNYFKDQDTWQQAYGDKIIQLETCDLVTTSPQELPLTIKTLADAFHQQLNIQKGELVKAVLFQTSASDKYNRLLIIIHHLAIDGVSWRILLEDMETLLSLNNKGLLLKLPAKKTSYRQWYQSLERYGKSNKVLQQAQYWQNTHQLSQPLKTDYTTTASIKAEQVGYYQATVDKNITTQLLQQVSKVYNTEINDLLLAALGKTFKDYCNITNLLIGLESHGREAIEPAIDINNTVGWFTTLFPVLIQTDQVANNDELIKTVKEQLRKIPGKGLGYGVLKYINKEEVLQGRDPWELVFNYLGQLDNVVKHSKWLSPASEPVGLARSTDAFIHEKIAINAFVQEGQLVVGWTYSQLHFNATTIEKLANAYVAAIAALVAQCMFITYNNENVLTPFDVGLHKHITYKDLDGFLKTFNSDVDLQVERLYPLTGLQQGMLFHSLYSGGTGAYIEQFSCHLTNINIEIFKKSWQQVIGNHGILRTAFFAHALNVPVQVVFKKVDIPVSIIDLEELKFIEQEAAVKFFEEKDRNKGIDVTQVPLMRITLIKVTSGYRMVWTYHHLLSDGWSLPVLMQEFLQAYDDLSVGRQPAFQTPDNYGDYINFINNIDKEAEENYWRDHLRNVEEPTLLPFIITNNDRNRSDGLPQNKVLALTPQQTDQLHKYASANRVTVNTIMQGALAYVLAQYTGNSHVVFGITVSGRPDSLPNIEQRVGLYINTLPFYANITTEVPVTDWLNQLQKSQVNSLEFQQTPLANIQSWTGIPGDLFDTLLIFENYPISQVLTTKTWGLQATNVNVEEQTNYPLNIIVQDAGQVRIIFKYNSGLVSQAEVESISGHFNNVLQQIISGEHLVDDLEILSAAEIENLTVGVNQTNQNFDLSNTIVDLFVQQAAKTPDNVALVWQTQTITYKQLHESSNQLAHFLKSNGVTNHSLVPICYQRNIDMVTGMLAVLKCGAAYIPIDPAYPTDRILYMIGDSKANLLLTYPQIQERLFPNNMVSVYTDNHVTLSGAQPNNSFITVVAGGSSVGHLNFPTSDVPTAPGILDNAYIIYTSGSTGQPKGVVVNHQNLLNLIHWHVKEFSVTSQSKATSMAGVGFDAFLWEVWPYLSTGASVTLVENDMRLSAKSLIDFLHLHSITHSFIPTAIAPEVIQQAKDNLPGLKFLLTGGEKLPPLNLEGIGFKVVNNYGPTENTVVATSFVVPKTGSTVNLPIGKPIANNCIYLVNKFNKLVPNGVTGEIYIGGESVAVGYLNQPELTNAKFVNDQFNTGNHRKLYKTGDLGKRLADGNIEYHGRIDDQIKIRGYRIEPGEIEQALISSGFIKQAVVLVKTEVTGNKILVGYIVPDNDFDKHNVLLYLTGRLPEYMVPAVWVELDKLPLTPNGKVDKRLLLTLDTHKTENEYVAPETALEIKLAEIWQKLLGVEKIGVNDNFFELGGNSLLVMRLVSYIENELKLSIPMSVIFHSRSIKDLSKYFEIQLHQNVSGGPEKFEIIDI